ncbi:MAG: sigma-70 family RNA polymerase sigma factor [Puniceicoccales bacterium]|jgi:RNA polymerase sigma-70 factor (ECF subfamily)|nr:sigma-70 family RNA polymerase sigma factor [Puniceicoccales bacterium]
MVAALETLFGTGRVSEETAGDVVCAAGSAADEDCALVTSVQSGDLSAFDTLMRRHRERVFSTIYHLIGNREDAADLAQDAFIVAFRSIGRFRGQARFYTWLYRIAINLTMRHLRKKRLKKFFSFENMRLDAASEELLSVLASRLSGDRNLLLKELQRHISEALENLSIRHRTVIVLSEVEGLSTDEIAAVTETSPGTVRSRLHYAKEHLKILLQRYLGT